jgi:hypothetical protein
MAGLLILDMGKGIPDRSKEFIFKDKRVEHPPERFILAGSRNLTDMITLKKISKLSSLAIILFGLSGCAGGKEMSYTFEQIPPFTLGEVFYQDWVAGVKGGGSGTHVHITIDSYTDDVVIMDIYFGNRKTKAQNSPQYIDQYVGYFTNKARPDIIMDGDPVKESQNEPPEVIPFELEDNEAVLSYLHEGEVKYLKISNMERKPMLAYPSTNKKGFEDDNE